MSRAVAQDASEKSGVDASTLKRMLPMIAMMVTGYMAKKRTPAGAAPSSDGGGLGGMLTGDPLDDIMRKFGKH